MTHLIPHNLVPALMLAGNATLIFRNSKTDGRRQYHIKENRECTMYHVLWIKAPGVLDTEVYIGSIVNGIFRSGNTHDQPESLKFNKLWYALSTGTFWSYMEVMHTGRCCACGRELTDPESIRLGIGPQCGGRQ